MGNVGVGESFYFRDILSLAELKFTFMPDVVFFNCKLLLESSFLQLDTYSIQKNSSFLGNGSQPEKS